MLGACGHGPGAGDLRFDPASVDLATIEAGERAGATIDIHNFGPGATTLERASVRGSPAVSVVEDRCSGELAAGTSCTIQIGVLPIALGPLSAEVVVPSADGELIVPVVAVAAATLQVTVSGPGRVMSEPAGIDCMANAGACRARFTAPAVVVRASDDVTVRWSGACAGHGACQLVLAREAEVTAQTFAPALMRIDEKPVLWEVAHGVAIDSANRRIVTGEVPGEVTGVAWTTALAPDGTRAWTDRHDPGVEGHDTGYAIAIGDDDSVYIAGQWYSSSNTRFNEFVRKLGSDGRVSWSSEGEEIGDDGNRGIALDRRTGELYVVGFAPEPFPSYHVQGRVRRLDATGGVLWERLWPGAGDGDDLALDVAIDGAGNAIVVGREAHTSTDADAWLAAWTPAGALLWQHRLELAGDDEAATVAIGPDGTIAVAGRRAGAGWLALYGGSGELVRELVAVEVAGWRGVAFAGPDELVVAGADTTRRYRVRDLTAIWSRSEPGLHVEDLAVDREGNVVAVGWIDDDIAIATYYQ